ncbi:transcriptional regulator [Kineosporia sp. NBRC 101677]|uniref:XRE family transcriptional regulator n=1 Tax=Kineosporia sp. NBRC 101677 TaxID=3032197 RepID=UPI0024A4A3A4|nr:XRE family transcriptional regulator [Kineosporia sp. NBRC 101677]GLY18011.1 transcriptional regulator [Kineosporia sp. NBRC 101677]
MANERLRAAMMQQGVSLVEIAELTEVDPKTVERWLAGRVPYRRTRFTVAQHLKVTEAYLWPGDQTIRDSLAIAESEIVTVFPHRYAVPAELWGQVFDTAEENIGILVYSGYFIAENAGLLTLLRSKAEAGSRVRILIGDPDSREVKERSLSEGIGDALVARIPNVIALLRPLSTVDGVEVRLHSTVLYNSIFWADEQVLVNPHIWGVGAPQAPVMHLRQVVGGTMVSTYQESFERVWESARALPEQG